MKTTDLIEILQAAAEQNPESQTVLVTGEGAESFHTAHITAMCDANNDVEILAMPGGLPYTLTASNSPKAAQPFEKSQEKFDAAMAIIKGYIEQKDTRHMDFKFEDFKMAYDYCDWCYWNNKTRDFDFSLFKNINVLCYDKNTPISETAISIRAHTSLCKLASRKLPLANEVSLEAILPIISERDILMQRNAGMKTLKEINDLCYYSGFNLTKPTKK